MRTGTRITIGNKPDKNGMIPNIPSEPVPQYLIVPRLPNLWPLGENNLRNCSPGLVVASGCVARSEITGITEGGGGAPVGLPKVVSALYVVGGL